MKKIAVLLTCFNRKTKTLKCLQSLYTAKQLHDYALDVFLVDDNSSDGTAEFVKQNFPKVNIIKGTGTLFWAGGMNLAWKTAQSFDSYYAYLLLNDDVCLYPEALKKLEQTHLYSVNQYGKGGVYVGSTEDPVNGEITYGGHNIIRNDIVMRSKLVIPGSIPIRCNFTNANILWVSREVVDIIGVFDKKYVHGIADYDYSYVAHKQDFPVLIAPGVLGACINDHGNSWKSSKSSLRSRIAYLKSPIGLGYKEYLYYIRKNFPLFYPYSFIMLWMKTLFPFFWDKFKTQR